MLPQAGAKPRGITVGLEVRFTPIAQGTRVDLEHRGWEALGPGADDAWKGYNEGWQGVFVQLFAAACGPPTRQPSK